MPKLGTYGSVRGVPGNRHPYRDHQQPKSQRQFVGALNQGGTGGRQCATGARAAQRAGQRHCAACRARGGQSEHRFPFRHHSFQS